MISLKVRAIKQMSGSNYIISIEQVLSSLSLRRLKLYHKLNLDATEITSSECVLYWGYKRQG